MNKLFKQTIDWYENHAVEYSKKIKAHPQYISPFILNLKGKKILDAGCGPGYDTNMFAEIGYEVVGIDIVKSFINLAKQKFPKLNFIQGNFLSLPFKDKAFDGIWAQASLLHLETIKDVKQALKEFHRVLKPNGILYVRVKKQEDTKKTVILTDVRFFRFFTKDELEKLLIKTGFSIIKSEEQESSKGKSEGLRIMILASNKKSVILQNEYK